MTTSSASGDNDAGDVCGSDVLIEAGGRMGFTIPTVVHLALCALLAVLGVVYSMAVLEPGSGDFGIAGGLAFGLVGLPLIAFSIYGLFAGLCFALALHFIGYRRFRLLCQLLPLPMALAMPHGPLLVYRLYTALGHPALKQEFDFVSVGIFGAPAIGSGMAGDDQPRNGSETSTG